MERARQLLSGDCRGQGKRLKKEIAELGEQRKALLTAYGYPEDYMEIDYTVVQTARIPDMWTGKKCHCFRRAQMKLLYAQSNIDNIVSRGEFPAFSCDCFDNTRICHK